MSRPTSDGGTEMAVHTPRLEPVFEATVQVGTVLPLGATPRGTRRMVSILGGTFAGKEMSGSVQPGGADWQYVRADGLIELHAQYLLKTDDGVLIEVVNRGLRHGPEEVMRRLADGAAVAPHEYYFRGAVQFSVAAGRYEWMNRSVFVCSGSRLPSEVRLSFYRVA